MERSGWMGLGKGVRFMGQGERKGWCVNDGNQETPSEVHECRSCCPPLLSRVPRVSVQSIFSSLAHPRRHRGLSGVSWDLLPQTPSGALLVLCWCPALLCFCCAAAEVQEMAWSTGRRASARSRDWGRCRGPTVPGSLEPTPADATASSVGGARGGAGVTPYPAPRPPRRTRRRLTKRSKS